MTLSKPQSLWAALAITLGLAGLHPLGPTLQRVRLVLERGFTSFGGGMAAAYVFLYLLPRLAEGNEAVGRVLEDRIELTPLTDLAVFVVALLGFLVFTPWSGPPDTRHLEKPKRPGSSSACSSCSFRYTAPSSPIRCRSSCGQAWLPPSCLRWRWACT